ncbi:unnamed protein product [Vicia faba]|uniref:Uncharacterized protein n=1 Tax=Vicia faba TaxID=3906 RepID=A0AAV1AEI2_VICFA|nr:unnamed protein product [Vicia faba]
MTIPARTSSVPPNIDEQKHDQAHHDSSRPMPYVPTPPVPKQLPVPKPLPANKDTGIVDQSKGGETHTGLRAKKKDTQSSHLPSPSLMHKPSVIPITEMSMAMPYHQSHAPVHFVVPNPQIQPRNATPSVHSTLQSINLPHYYQTSATSSNTTRLSCSEPAPPTTHNHSLIQTLPLFPFTPFHRWESFLRQSLLLQQNTNLKPWSFPSELTQSLNLVELDLGQTNLMGSLPDIFSPLFTLQNLRLVYNNLTGDLPNSVSGIQNLWLNNQQDGFGFTGSLDLLSSMFHSTQVWFQKNKFTGPIPDLTNCTNLFDLQLRDNQLMGVVPPSCSHH